jgi:ribosome-binding protein aMBF1 (putative translation factor)
MRLCGEPLRFYETCARRYGHKSRRHRSAAAMAAARRRAEDGQAATGTPEIAAAIRRAREDAGLSMRRLAAVVGVSDACIGLWERAQRTPAAEHWEQLELTLGPLGIVRDPGPAAGQDQQRSEAA